MGQKHYTLETWKEKATQVHNGKYTYEKVTEYKGSLKAEIYCTNCKEYFYQNLSNHLHGSGHPKCSKKDSYWTDIKPLIAKFKEIHGDTYDYSKFVYKGIKVKSTIICKIHGEFEQSPDKHYSNRGCPKCGNLRKNKDKIKSQELFIQQLNEKHPSKFKFDRLVYKNDKTPIILYCNSCKEYHEYIPNYLLTNRGCKWCREKREIRTFEDFYKKLTIKQRNEHIFHSETFRTSNTPMKVTHKKCGKTYKQRPNHILIRGCGCQYCAESGFKKNKDSILYYLEINHNNKKYYKIGITNNTIKNRYFKRDLEKITNQISFPMLGQKAWDWEKALIQEYKEHLYKGDEIILDSAKGNAELFTKDILGVINGS